MKKHSSLLIPIIIILIFIVTQDKYTLHVCSSLSDEYMEMFNVYTNNDDNVQTIEIIFEGNLEEPVNEDTLSEIMSTIQTIYNTIDGVSVSGDESELGDTYIEITLTIDATAYDFEVDELNRFNNLEMSEDTLSFDELNVMFEEENYGCE